MKKLNTFFASLLLTLGISSVGQAQICVGVDTTVCLNQPVQINECGATTNANSGAVVINNPTFLNLEDDQWSGIVNIGFTFNFYGNNHTQCVIGSNGLVTFNLNEANQGCSWLTSANQSWPSNSNGESINSAMLCYTDIDPSSGGFVYYKTEGTAPNRVFWVVYENIPSFGIPDCNFMALALFEGSNNIEYHILDKQINPNWNGGRATQGTHSFQANVGTITPGRNNSQWIASNDGRLFTPSGQGANTTYTMSEIPLKVVRRAGTTTSNYQWRSTQGQNFAWNNGVLTVPNNQLGTVGYFIIGQTTACNTVSAMTADTTWITVGNLALTTSFTSDVCLAGVGTATVDAVGGNGTYTYNWAGLGATTQTATNVPAGTHQVQVEDTEGCRGTVSVTVPNQTAAFTTTNTRVSCPGGSDGTATAVMTPTLGDLTYLWSNGQTTATATGLSVGTYTVEVSSTTGCVGTASVTIQELPPLTAIVASYTDVTCNQGSDGAMTIHTTGGTAPYTYLWSGSTTATNANLSFAYDLSVGDQSVLVTDAKGCTVALTQTLDQAPPLSIVSITPDTQICPEDEITLTVEGEGGNSVYIFNWFENGVPLGDFQTITVNPDFTDTEYCVQMTEVCATSQMVSQCMTVTFPTPVPPQLVAVNYEDCLPALLEFSNTSPNMEDLVSTYIDFGDETNEIYLNGEGGSHVYENVGEYTLTVINTSIHGCLYTVELPAFFTALPPPTAFFNFQNNPTSVFETTVPAYSKSSPDVVSWQWIAPGAIPGTSTMENPTFVYPEGDEAKYPVTLIVTSFYGCTDTLTLDLILEDQVLVYAANSFTPNGDEFNNIWKPFIKGIDIYSFNLTIFNRWGEAVFESHDVEIGWDGTYNGEMVPSGQYIWKADVRNKNNDGKHTFSGGITLLR